MTDRPEKVEPKTDELRARIRELEAQVVQLREQQPWQTKGDTVRVPDSIKSLFDVAQETVRQYFAKTTVDPARATIEISGERYVLLRASSLSVDFLATIRNLYADLGEEEAFAVGRNFLFDISHVIGMEDAKNFHKKMGVSDPIARLSAGPVHFAYSGWAFVDISPESSPHPNDEFFMKYDHPFSFEADAWIKAGKQSDHPVCIMNAGYSSGWCEASFGVQLTAVELTCKAAGDEACTFIMAPPHMIEGHVSRYVGRSQEAKSSAYQIPTFFERKRVEEEMKTARRKAEESDRMKSEFLANMSHEIRTPMNAVIGMTELVLDTQLTDVQREYLTTTLESAESLMTIINQMLDFSKIEAGKLELDSIAFSLRECVGDTLKSLALRAHTKGLELAWRVASGVPDGVRGDPSRLRQIIVNLVGNAIKFTDRGEVVVEVELEDTSGDQAILHFTIRDTGIGIPQEKRDAIFQAFTQVDMSTTRTFGGTGLGLTIASNLVQLMGGRIWVESEPGQGSVFHFKVWLDRDAVVLPEHAELVHLPIVMVGERNTNRSFLVETMQSWGLSVTWIEDPSSAVEHLVAEQAAGKPPSVLMADITSDLSLVSAVRSRSELEGTKIIGVTAGYHRGDVQRLDDLGVDACLMKPVKQSELVAAIKRMQKSRTTILSGSGPKKARTKETTPKKAINILLVEDGKANQKFAVAMLSRWGHSVAIADNGKQAIELLQDSANQFDLVLMDVLMPEMDGVQATMAIRQYEKNTGTRIPIIAITAQAMRGDRERCLAAGMDDYLSKPIRRKDLQQAIEKLQDS